MEKRFAVLLLAALVLGLSLPLSLSTLMAPGAPITPSQAAISGPHHSVGAELRGVPTFSTYEELFAFLERAARSAQSIRYTTAGMIPEAQSFKLGSAAEPYSLTNVQVEGVDEADVVKTDGRIIAVASGDRVYLVDAAGRRIISRIDVGGLVLGLYLNGSRLVALHSDYTIARPINTTVTVYDVSDPSGPRRVGSLSFTGYLVSTRMNSGVVYLVLSLAALPRMVPLVDGAPLAPSSIGVLSSSPTHYTVVAAVDPDTLRSSAVAFLTGSSSWIYMSAEGRLYAASSYVPSREDAAKLLLRALAMHAPSDASLNITRALEQGDLEAALRAAEAYLRGLRGEEADALLKKAAAEVGTLEDSTRFYVFSTRGLHLDFSGSFEVPGVVLDQFSMEERRGHFIVATTSRAWGIEARFAEPVKILGPPKEEQGRVVTVEVLECSRGTCEVKLVNLTVAPAPPPEPVLQIWPLQVGESENNVFVVSTEGLRLLGEVRGLAPGERIYASRLVGEILFLVTFRQVDPLFAIDMSDPSRPEVLGFLKVPGFSEYLHPLPGGKLLGLGVESSALKISLFDVSNPRSMRETAALHIADSWSQALGDHHAVTVDPDRQRIYVPVTIHAKSAHYTSSGVAVIRYVNDELTLEGVLEHPGASRTIYIGAEVFTVSGSSVRVFDAATLDRLAEVKLE
ncbi:MAG: beta-propeller domain-containing protein [Fervidicoccaceae archaeon]